MSLGWQGKWLGCRIFYFVMFVCLFVRVHVELCVCKQIYMWVKKNLQEGEQERLYMRG